MGISDNNFHRNIYRYISRTDTIRSIDRTLLAAALTQITEIYYIFTDYDSL